MKRFLLLSVLFTFLVSLNLLAQQPVDSDVAMADQMRADGKIWVVVGVIALIFAGIITYLIRLDSKLSKIEKELNIN
ncbi:CcmD family protein [Arundinibacter roseus]|uniref:CcmD family protein n=1 Tax=Arundinibacter roseus TaxID=2070510 RepID=A0A4R4KMD3_9BACT|nr:CcmD family protein [Arundinibacter roseus]TDB68186.1 CcmD family protein [Arundinibacter roseus]